MQVYPSGRTRDNDMWSRQLAVLRRLGYLTVRMIFAPDQAKRRRGKWTAAEPNMRKWKETVMAHRTLESFDHDKHSIILRPSEPLIWR
jgi:hypothetical protein